MAEGRRDPQPGDLIAIGRPGYQHWALYVGDGYVIHVTDVGARDVFMSVNFTSTLTGTATVKKERLKDVVGNQNWRVNNEYDQDHTPRPVEEIIQDAESFVGIRFRYNLMTNNCEHFVTLLRYDEKFSEQVKNAVKCGKLIALFFIGLLIEIAWAKFSKKKPLRARVRNDDRDVEEEDAINRDHAHASGHISANMMNDWKLSENEEQRSNSQFLVQVEDWNEERKTGHHNEKVYEQVEVSSCASVDHRS